VSLTLQAALGLSAALTAFLAILLATAKLVHREALRWRGVRTAHYVAAVGELVSRKMTPSRPPRAWAEDPLFHQALADYRHLVTGDERDHIAALTETLGVYEALLRRVRPPHRLKTRLRAAASLAELATERHRNLLRELAVDSNSHIRVHAVRGLAALRDRESIPWILDHATAVQPWEAARIADALIEMGRVAVGPLRDWIEEEMDGADPPIETVGLAARVLGLIGDPDAEPTLIRLLRSDQPDWRVAAASALEKAGTDEAVSHLLDALEDRASKVRARVAVALGATAEPRVARPLASLLYDESWWVRQNAATALGLLPGGTDYLLAAIHGPDRYAADAALNQLTTSGVLGSAVERIRSGTGSDRDRRLATLADVPT
jgi:hypothetical protein